MAEKETLGHQKILMPKTDDEDDIYSTFPKRYASLNKKANDLIGKYVIDVGMIIFPHIDNPFSFFHPSNDDLVDRFFSPYVQGSEREAME
ncbi:hypothetical protein KY289_035417 [Solanum tuberosum]|nr:hypothetical protein KY289_035417 [Solanum tuberosum]